MRKAITKQLRLIAALTATALSSCSVMEQMGMDNSSAPTSPSYVAIESNSGRVIYASNSNEKRPIAMLTNVATAAVILDWIENRSIDPCTMITAPKEVLDAPSTNMLQLRPGDRISIRDALNALILLEDSACASTLAHACGVNIGDSSPISAFVAQMNQLARRLGMDHTRFRAPHGVTISKSSAKDLALLGSYVCQKQAFRLISSQKQSHAVVHSATGEVRDLPFNNINRMLAFSDTVDGMKATRSQAAGSCLMVSARRVSYKQPDPETGKSITYPQNMVIVILGMSSNDRYRAAASFLKDGWAMWENWIKTADVSDPTQFIKLP